MSRADSTAKNRARRKGSVFVCEGKDSWQNHSSLLQQSLNEVTTDLMDRLNEGDHTILSGITVYLYNTMKQSHSPTPAIAYVLHNFRCPDNKLV